MLGLLLQHARLSVCSNSRFSIGSHPGISQKHNTGRPKRPRRQLEPRRARRLESRRYGRRIASPDKHQLADIGRYVIDATLGIVGMGSIGRITCKHMQAFGMKVLYHNRNELPEDRRSTPTPGSYSF